MRDELDDNIESFADDAEVLSGPDIDWMDPPIEWEARFDSRKSSNMQPESCAAILTPSATVETLDPRTSQIPLSFMDKYHAIHLQSRSSLETAIRNKTSRGKYNLSSRSPDAFDAYIAKLVNDHADLASKTHLQGKKIDTLCEVVRSNRNDSQLGFRAIKMKLSGLEQKLDKLADLEEKLDNFSRLEKKLDRFLDIFGSSPPNASSFPQFPFDEAFSSFFNTLQKIGASVPSTKPFFGYNSTTGGQKPVAEEPRVWPEQSRRSTLFQPNTSSTGRFWDSTRHKLVAKSRKERELRGILNPAQGSNYMPASADAAEELDPGLTGNVKTRKPLPLTSYDKAVIEELRAVRPLSYMEYRKSKKHHHEQKNQPQAYSGSSPKSSRLIGNINNGKPVNVFPSTFPNCQPLQSNSASNTITDPAAINAAKYKRYVANIQYPTGVREPKITNTLDRMMSAVDEAAVDIPSSKVPVWTNTQGLPRKAMDKSQQVAHHHKNRVDTVNTSITEEVIELVMEETSCSRQEAVKALEKENGDIVDAIMRLSI